MGASEGRHLGLEQEFFLVDEGGVLSNRADEFLDRCREAARAAGIDPEGFAQECSWSLVEVNTPPARSLDELSREYLYRVSLALESGRELGLRLYPLATYPLDNFGGGLRDDLTYRVQARTVGPGRFANAGRCAGTHLHLEVEPGTIDPRVGVSYGASQAAREELLDLYNLATALDPALMALTRSCPYFAGIADGRAMRTAHYRGDPDLAPHGVYALLQEVGALRPYAGSTEELVELQFSRYHAWLGALDRAGVDRSLFYEAGGGLLKASAWNPVRLNPQGTVELRGIDSSYPRVVLAAGALVNAAAERVRREGLKVLPREGVRAFEVAGGRLLVPDFGYLVGVLFRDALTSGTGSDDLATYIDSVLDFADLDGERAFGASAGGYETVEAGILRRYARGTVPSLLPEERGLELVLEACDELEEQVVSLRGGEPMAPIRTVNADGV